MLPFKLLRKHLHLVGGRVLYESNWQDTCFRFGKEEAAWRKKGELETFFEGKMRYKVVSNDCL